jgi:hypothetical protein
MSKGKHNYTAKVLPIQTKPAAGKSKSLTYKNRVVRIIDDKSTGVIKFGKDNAFPQRLIEQLDESGTASLCIEVLTQYVQAEGLVNEDVGKLPANDKQTFNELISEEVPYLVPFHAVALYVMRGPDGKVKQVKVLPTEQLRVNPANEWIINPTWGTKKFEAKQDAKFPSFYGSEISTEKLKEHIEKYSIEKGEVLYYFRKRPMKTYYSVPYYYAGIEDINTDAENSKLELESVTNGFITSGMLTIVGNYDDATKDETGKTEQDYLDETLESFTGNVKDEDGASGRNKLLILQAKTKEELPDYKSISSEGVFNAIDKSTDRIAHKVARLFGVPPFLVGLGGSVGFSSDIIADNITLFNNRVLILQRLLSDALRLCFPDKDFTMTQLNPIRDIPPEVLSKLSDAEVRALYGYETSEEKATSSIPLAQALGTGTTGSLIQVLQDQVLTPLQKENTLQILFGLSEEQSKKLIDKGTIDAGNGIQTTNNKI